MAPQTRLELDQVDSPCVEGDIIRSIIPLAECQYTGFADKVSVTPVKLSDRGACLCGMEELGSLTYNLYVGLQFEESASHLVHVESGELLDPSSSASRQRGWPTCPRTVI
jgi:hypothetical protein